MTKKQLEILLADMKTKLTLAQNNYEAAYADVNRLAATLDDVEQKNREASTKLMLAQNKINHLTSALKSTTSIL